MVSYDDAFQRFPMMMMMMISYDDFLLWLSYDDDLW